MKSLSLSHRAKNALTSKNPEKWRGLIFDTSPEMGNQGATPLDFSGHGNNLTLNGMTAGSAWGLGETRRYLSFDGVNDYIQNSVNSAYGSLSFTIMAWVYIPGSIQSSWRAILEHRRFASNWYGLYKSGNGNWFHFRWNSVGGAAGTKDFVTIISPNVWYRVVGVYDSSINTARLYLDGVFDSEKTGATNPSAAVGGPYRIGANHDGGEFFTMRLGNARVYNRPLSQLEVEQDYVDSQSLFRRPQSQGFFVPATEIPVSTVFQTAVESTSSVVISQSSAIGFSESQSKAVISQTETQSSTTEALSSSIEFSQAAEKQLQVGSEFLKTIAKQSSVAIQSKAGLSTSGETQAEALSSTQSQSSTLIDGLGIISSSVQSPCGSTITVSKSVETQVAPSQSLLSLVITLCESLGTTTNQSSVQLEGVKGLSSSIQTAYGSETLVLKTVETQIGFSQSLISSRLTSCESSGTLSRQAETSVEAEKSLLTQPVTSLESAGSVSASQESVYGSNTSLLQGLTALIAYTQSLKAALSTSSEFLSEISLLSDTRLESGVNLSSIHSSYIESLLPGSSQTTSVFEGLSGVLSSPQSILEGLSEISASVQTEYITEAEGSVSRSLTTSVCSSQALQSVIVTLCPFGELKSSSSVSSVEASTELSASSITEFGTGKLLSSTKLTLGESQGSAFGQMDSLYESTVLRTSPVQTPGESLLEVGFESSSFVENLSQTSSSFQTAYEAAGSAVQVSSSISSGVFTEKLLSVSGETPVHSLQSLEGISTCRVEVLGGVSLSSVGRFHSSQFLSLGYEVGFESLEVVVVGSQVVVEGLQGILLSEEARFSTRGSVSSGQLSNTESHGTVQNSIETEYSYLKLVSEVSGTPIEVLLSVGVPRTSLFTSSGLLAVGLSEGNVIIDGVFAPELALDGVFATESAIGFF